ncbi:tetratricopeptide repeat protein [candidate division KSB1 bacterium]|nr:tetratricopeptide repeat protein [candidate division KSB1 bacterium]
MSTEEQITYLESRLEDNPKSLVFARLADLYLDQNRVDEAIQLCTAGVKHNPSYVTGHYILAKAYILSEDYENAESALKQVISHDREFLTAHKLLGDLMRKLGWENKAATHYRDIIQIDPLEEKVRSILELLDESLVEEGNDQPDSDPVEESIEYPAAIDSEISDWMNEIKEVFPDEIKPETEISQSDTSASEEVVPILKLESESVETFSELGLDEPEASAVEETNNSIESHSKQEEPVISETPEFFTIKGEEGDGKGFPEEEIAAEFLSPEQLSESPETQIGEEVVSDEVEISEVIVPLEIEESVEPEESSTKSIQPEKILDVDSILDNDEDGSDFAQALDALEAMDSETDSSVKDGSAEAVTMTETIDDTPVIPEIEFGESNEATVVSEAEEPASDPQDEPLMHEDSGLEPIDSSESAVETLSKESVTQSENDTGDSALEWELADEAILVEKEPEIQEIASLEEETTPEETHIEDEYVIPEIIKQDIVPEKIPKIKMTPAETDETESFTPDDLNLDIKADPDLPPVEDLEKTDQDIEPVVAKPETKEKPLEPETSATPLPVEAQVPKAEATQPAETQTQETDDASEENIEPTEIEEKSTPKIVTPTLGEIYAAQGQYDKALVVFEELLEQNPNEQRYKDKIAELKRNLETPLE